MKRIISLILATFSVFVLLVGCSEKEESISSGDVTILNYPTGQVGVNTSAAVVKQFVEEFNKKHEGQYKVVVEEIPGDANYIEKIKIMLGNKTLPPVIYGAGYNLLDLALEQDLLVDLTEQINADEAWLAMYNEQALDVNSRDGKIYGVPNEKSIIGYYYNKDLFAQAGIEKPAETWDEFFAQCDQLVASGIKPLALDTADSAWITSLWLGAIAATQNESGFEFIQTMNPTDYNTPEFIKALEDIQMMLQKYSTLDAVGGKYDNAANNFLSSQVAIIANGSWMMGDFSDESKSPEGFAKKVGVAKFPGDFIYNDPIQGYLVTKNEDPKVVEGSIAFVKHMTSEDYQLLALESQGIIPSSSTIEVTETAHENFPLLADIVSIAQKAKLQSKYTQATMYPNLLDVLSRQLPNLANGSITATEMAIILTAEAKKNL